MNDFEEASAKVVKPARSVRFDDSATAKYRSERIGYGCRSFGKFASYVAISFCTTSVVLLGFGIIAIYFLGTMSLAGTAIKGQ